MSRQRLSSIAGDYHPASRRVPALGAYGSVAARYDAAQTTTDNVKHWGMSDSLSAEGRASIAVRKTLRNRARYECDNNAYAKGVVSTIANDTVGTGPTLQMTVTMGDGRTPDAVLNSALEGSWEAWAREVRLAEKLRTFTQARVRDGEALLMLVSNPALRHAVKLDVTVIECDRLSDPTVMHWTNPYWDDGVEFDELGNVTNYRILKWHPGSTYWTASPLDYDDVSSRFVWHWFKADRPGQRRGVSELAAVLPVFAELRRYCQAVLAAAETAADFAALIKTPAPAGGSDDNPTTVESMDVVELTKRGALVLPEGFDVSQLKAEQPTTTYPAFVRQKLAEIGRALNIPVTLMDLDSSQSNLSARYLDTQVYLRDRLIDRAELAAALDWMLDHWLTEAVMVRSVPGIETPTTFPHQWFWPSLGQHADPEKVAAARAQNLKLGLTTIPREYATEGLDWEQEQESAARSMGMSVAEYRALVRYGTFGTARIEAPAAEKGPDPLNGVQITAAMEVLSKLVEKTVSPTAAETLLTGIGLPADRAVAIVAEAQSRTDIAPGDRDFQREMLKTMLAVPGAAASIYNITDIEDLVRQAGLPPEKPVDGREVQAPFLPVIVPTGAAVTGEVAKDSAGDIVGGVALPPPPSQPIAQNGNQGEQRQAPEQPETDDADDSVDEAPNDAQQVSARAGGAEDIPPGVLQRLRKWARSLRGHN